MAKSKPSRVIPKAKKPAARKVSKPVAKSPAKAAKAKPKAPAAGKWVYSFGGGKAEGKPNMRNLLGGKGAGLAEMANLGLPVPPGFTITMHLVTPRSRLRLGAGRLRDRRGVARSGSAPSPSPRRALRRDRGCRSP